jgi:predicted  nucleic acid-binding Zn-ribbon protein
MGRRREPVKNTCPDIDRIKEIITSIVKQMDRCDKNDSIESLLENIEDWSSSLGSIGFGRTCELEDLRDSNSSLRDWGNQMYEEANDLENEVSKLTDQIVELEDQISDLNDEIKDLQNERETEPS